MKITNFTNTPVGNFQMQLNRNYFGLVLNTENLSYVSVNPNGSTEAKVPVMSGVNSDFSKIPPESPLLLVEAAISCSLDEYYFNIPVLFSVLFEQETMHISKEEYLTTWKKITTTSDMCLSMNNLHSRYQNVPAILERLEANNIYLIHKIENESQGNLVLI